MEDVAACSVVDARLGEQALVPGSNHASVCENKSTSHWPRPLVCFPTCVRCGTHLTVANFLVCYTASKQPLLMSMLRQRTLAWVKLIQAEFKTLSQNPLKSKVCMLTHTRTHTCTMALTHMFWRDKYPASTSTFRALSSFF